MRDGSDRWTLAQLFMWLDRGEPLRADEWPAVAFYPTDWTASADEHEPPPATVAANLNKAASGIKAAAAAGEITLYGRRQMDADRPASADDQEEEPIPAATFSRLSLALYPGMEEGSDRIGPGEANEGFGATKDASDPAVIPRWSGVTARAAEAVQRWPKARPELDAWMVRYATTFGAEKGRPPARDKEAVRAAQRAGFGMNAARAAYAKLPDTLKAPNRKPKQGLRK